MADRGWWVIHGDTIVQALNRAADGEDPELIYTELYANADTENPDA